MNIKPSNLFQWFRNLSGTWQAAAAISLLLLVLFAWWVMPRRLERVVSADGQHQWRAVQAPPRREIVWEKPRALLEIEDGSEVDLVTPQLADSGATLFFARRDQQGQADIFRTRRIDSVWQPPEPVTEFNTPSDELGPVVSADGQTIYFFSNREGGHGGFDLYRAQRAENRWESPQNLGPVVNSTAHEYDPALGPDGLLLFASNRTRANSATPVDGKQDEEMQGPWSATLRAHPGLTQFDLYRTRQTAAGTWSSPEPLTEINRSESNEGAPYVSPHGTFLYFASDRPVGENTRPIRPGEALNLDLYRARWNGRQYVELENLGPEVNSAAHETEPSLSPEGYTLLFSSNRDGRDRLYASTALEVYHDVAWDAANLRALSGIWWQALLLTALLVAVALIFWKSQGWMFEKASAARFFAASLLLHLVILALMMLVPLAQVVFEVAAEIRVNDPATQLFDNNQHQSHEDGEEAYEKLADLQAPQAETLPEIQRQETEEFNIPQPTETPIASLPPQRVRNVSPDRVEFVPVAQPPQPVAEKPPAELVRRTRAMPSEVAMLEAVPIETPTEATPTETPLEVPAEQIERQMASVIRPSADIPNVDIPRTRRPLKLAVVELPLSENAPVPEDVPEPTLPAQTRRTLPKVADIAEPVMQELAVGEAAATADQPITAAAVEVPRDATESIRPAPPTSVPAMLESPVRRRAPLELAALEATPALDTSIAQSNPLEMPRKSRIPATADSPLAEALPVTGTTQPTETLSEQADISLARGSASLPEIAPGLIPTPIQRRVRAITDTTVRLAKVETSPPVAEPVRPLESAPTMTRPVAKVDVAADSLEAVPLTGTSETPAESPMATAANVEVARNETDTPTAAKTMELADTPLVFRRTRTIEEAIQTTADLAAVLPTPQSAPTELARATPNAGLEDALIQAEAAETPMGAESAAESPLEGASVVVSRLDPTAVAINLPDKSTMGGPSRLDQRLVLGVVAEQRLDAPPSFNPIASRLNRPRALGREVALAEDNVGMEAMFTLRQGETRKEFIELFGGTEATEAAVNRGLEWLAAHQNENGSWSLHKHEGGTNSDTAGTGFALLPFLAAGHTPDQGTYKAHVEKGVNWLVSQQKENGDLLSKGENEHHQMYAHGVATIALCEAYGMSKREDLKLPVARALQFIVQAQHGPSGGWRYRPNEPGDTSVVGWQVMALKSGEMAGMPVPQNTLDGVRRWLASVESNQPIGGQFGYASRGSSPAMTAEGLLCLQFLGTPRNDPRMRAGAEYLLDHLPAPGKETSYYWYYGTQMMYHMQGDYWDAWNSKTRDMLVTTQVTQGSNAGTWNPTDQWEKSGGRVFSTAVKLLMLEVYYRHLPLYQQLDD